jgi:hypothetical protein
VSVRSGWILVSCRRVTKRADVLALPCAVMEVVRAAQDVLRLHLMLVRAVPPPVNVLWELLLPALPAGPGSSAF